MIYTVIINDRSYDLPKRTLEVVELLDKTANVDSIKGMSLRDKYKKIFECIETILGRESTVEIIGSENIDEVDLSEVTLTFRKIVDAYNKPLDDYNNEKSLRGLNELPIDKIIALASAASEVQGLQSKK